MTTATTKERVQQTWSIDKIQQEAVRVFSRNCMSTSALLEKIGGDALQQHQEQMLKNKVEFFKSVGVKTPLELIKAMAEFETNVFGSKIVFWGDEKSASMEYETCACFEQMQKDPNFKPENMEKMGKMFAEHTEKLGKEFGFKGEMKMVGEKAQITFSKDGMCCG